MEKKKTAVIIGAGPAGLTAAYELLIRTGIVPTVIEQTDRIGGLACTINYKGNRMDIGGHRFFSKSDRVLKWWFQFFSLEERDSSPSLWYHRQTTSLPNHMRQGNPDVDDRVMLIRPRSSHIFYSGHLFPYPLSLSLSTLKKLGLKKIVRIALSYTRALCFPIKLETTLEDFFTNRFGRELYTTFFKSYTEKVWGVPCSQLSADWGRQRIKTLSLARTVIHAICAFLPLRSRQEKTETSLIEQFLYPKYGPGQLWEAVAEEIIRRGGVIRKNEYCKKITLQSDDSYTIETQSLIDESYVSYDADFVFSTMPIRECLRCLDPAPPAQVLAIGDGLRYRDFLTVGLLLSRSTSDSLPPSLREGAHDTWMYIQDPSATVGRIQFFNNWSPYLVADPKTRWIGMEYFCSRGEALWKMGDTDLISHAKNELEHLGIARSADVIDGTVARMEYAYPAYTGTYNQFDRIRAYLDTLPRFYCVGRNGMHTYNNQDHSMLTAMAAVDNIVSGSPTRSSLWDINAEQEYHEEKQ